MATIEDLLIQSNQSSPIQPLRSTTLPSSTQESGLTQDQSSNAQNIDTNQENPGEYEWDTPSPIYDFGIMRLRQQRNEIRAAGVNPVLEAVWRKDVRSSGGQGGQVFRDYSDETFDYEQRQVEARKRYESERQQQQFRLIRERERSLSERQPYEYPITDIV